MHVRELKFVVLPNTNCQKRQLQSHYPTFYHYAKTDLLNGSPG